MARVVDTKVRFRPSASSDVTRYFIRAVGDYTAQAVIVPSPTPDPDGYVRVPVSQIPFLAGVEGEVEVFITAADAAGNESDFLRVAGPLDLSPPAAPTDGSLE